MTGTATQDDRTMTEKIQPKILIVDDRPENLLALEVILTDEPFDIIKASSGNEALAQVLSHEFALVLLDVQMPEMDGFETAELMRSNKKTAHVPIIFLTAISKEDTHISHGYESGAVDYMLKPIDPVILKSKISIFIDLYKQRKEIEEKNTQLDSANQMILEQQKALVEEERLKLLLQLAGARASELDQPLKDLLDNIEILKKLNGSMDTDKDCLAAIDKSGKHIRDIVRRIQLIQDGKMQHRRMPEKRHEQINVVMVEDDDSSFSILGEMLKRKRDIRLIRAKTIAEGKSRLAESDFDLAILDLKLPDGDAFEILNHMREHRYKMAVVVITGYGDEAIAAQCIQAGAHGYLSKGDISLDALHKCIDHAFEQYSLDSEMEKAVARMAEMATRDELTLLYNRRFMQEILDREFGRAMRYQMDLSCILLDLDYFKKVNDTHGHACGDYVLKTFAAILKQHIRASDYAFRYGGEEFMVLLTQTGIDGSAKLAEKIRAACESMAYTFENATLHITVSIGMAAMGQNLPEHPKDLIASADAALYQAKADGRNCIRIYSPDMGDCMQL